jgi:hypothetical protein
LRYAWKNYIFPFRYFYLNQRIKNQEVWLVSYIQYGFLPEQIISKIGWENYTNSGVGEE